MTTKELTIKDPIRAMLDKYRGAIENVLPAHITPEKALRMYYVGIYRIPGLKECSPLSLINGLIEISMLGLDLGRTAHLIPYGKEATLIVDYKGFIDLAHRSGRIESFTYKPVYASDFFDYEEGTTRFIKHKPFRGSDRGLLVAAYACVFFKHGGFDFEVVEKADVDAVKKRSSAVRRGKADSPWLKEIDGEKVDEWIMWCKTAVRRLAKRVPQSPELSRAIQIDELAEIGLKQNLGNIADEIIDLKDTDLTSKIQGQTHGQDQEKEKTVSQTAGFMGAVKTESPAGGSGEPKVEPNTDGEYLKELEGLLGSKIVSEELFVDFIEQFRSTHSWADILVAAKQDPFKFHNSFAQYKKAIEDDNRGPEAGKTDAGEPETNKGDASKPEMKLEPGKPHPWDRSAWISMRVGNRKNTGFAVFVLRNEGTFYEASEEDQAEARRKWASLYKDPFPIKPKTDWPNKEEMQAEAEDDAAKASAALESIKNFPPVVRNEALKRLGFSPNEPLAIKLPKVILEVLETCRVLYMDYEDRNH